MREASNRRTVTDPDSYASFFNKPIANEGMTAAYSAKMKKCVILIITIVIYILDVNACYFYPANGSFDFQKIVYYANHDKKIAETRGTLGQPSGYHSIPFYADRCSCPISYRVIKIGDFTFRNCKGLTQVYLPASIENIGIGAFMGCSALTDINIPNSVTYISGSAFEGCSGLTNINISRSVEVIGSSAFYGCSSLKEVTFSEYIENLYAIGNSAFAECSSLTKICIPKGVMQISHNLFHNCTSLKYVEIPITCTIIGNFAFQGCSSLSEITIPEGVTKINKMAFSGCSSLSTVTLPSSLQEVGEVVWYGCSHINTVVCMGQNPVKADKAIFDTSVYYNATLWVPEGTKNKYMSTSPWSNFMHIMEGNPAGIEEVFFIDDTTIDYSQPYEIYNLSGVRVSQDIHTLTTGIYIIRQGNTIKKIFVK